MALIEHSTLIAAPVTEVYRISQDYAVRYEWDPFPERIEHVAASAASAEAAGEVAVGSQVLVRSKLGMNMYVAFVQLRPPTRAAVKMVQGPWFLAKFAGSWVFQAQSPDTTLARFRYTLVAAPRLLRRLIEPLAALYFSRVVVKRLAGLKAFCERPDCTADAGPDRRLSPTEPPC